MPITTGAKMTTKMLATRAAAIVADKMAPMPGSPPCRALFAERRSRLVNADSSTNTSSARVMRSTNTGIKVADKIPPSNSSKMIFGAVFATKYASPTAFPCT